MTKSTCANCGMHWKTPTTKKSAWDYGNPFTWEKDTYDDRDSKEEENTNEKLDAMRNMLKTFTEMFPETAQITKKMTEMVDGKKPQPKAEDIWKRLQSATDKRKDRENKLSKTTKVLEQKEQEVEQLQNDKNRLEQEVEELKYEIATLTDQHMDARNKEAEEEVRMNKEQEMRAKREASSGNTTPDRRPTKLRKPEDQEECPVTMRDSDSELASPTNEGNYIVGDNVGTLS